MSRFSPRSEWDIVVPASGDDLLATLHRLGVEPGQRLHLRAVPDATGESPSDPAEVSEPTVAAAQGSGGVAADDSPPPAGLLALIGVFDGPADLAERHDDYVHERMSDHFSDPA